MVRPIVSVLMTAYNREKYIAEAIESVLWSSLTDLELIIVDDGSKDSTVAIAREYEQKDKRVRVFLNGKNLGDYPNRNMAASYATGKYIKFVDSDDIVFPSCLKRMVETMELYPEAGFGLCSEINDDSTLCTQPRETYLEHFNKYGHFDRSPGGSIIRNDAFKALGGFTGLRQVGDFQFWFIIGARYPMVKLPFQIYWVREHQEKESVLDSMQAKDKLRLQVLTEIFATYPVPLNQMEKRKFLMSYNGSFYNKLLRKVDRLIKRGS